MLSAMYTSILQALSLLKGSKSIREMPRGSSRGKGAVQQGGGGGRKGLTAAGEDTTPGHRRHRRTQVQRSMYTGGRGGHSSRALLLFRVSNLPALPLTPCGQVYLE